MSHVESKNPLRFAGTGALWLVAVAAVVSAPGVALPQDEFPTTAGEARRFYEGRVDEWTDGPAEMIMTVEEREIWGELEDTAQKERFIQWFWDRRDDDLRDRQHPFKEGFYVRVASANERFSGFPRGWRSDRGRVWIVLGRPDGIRSSGLRNEIWIYNTYGGILRSSSVMGQMEVGFVQVDTAGWEVAGGFGPGAWPAYVLQAFDIVNRAVIQHPTLEWK